MARMHVATDVMPTCGCQRSIWLKAQPCGPRPIQMSRAGCASEATTHQTMCSVLLRLPDSEHCCALPPCVWIHLACASVRRQVWLHDVHCDCNASRSMQGGCMCLPMSGRAQFRGSVCSTPC